MDNSIEDTSGIATIFIDPSFIKVSLKAVNTGSYVVSNAEFSQLPEINQGLNLLTLIPLGANDWAIAWDCATVVNGPRSEAPDEEIKPSTSAVSKLSLGGSVA